MRNCLNCYHCRVACDEKHTWMCKIGKWMIFKKDNYMEHPRLHGWFCKMFRKFGKR